MATTLTTDALAPVAPQLEEAKQRLLAQPWWLDWTAGLFPVIVAVFVLRSFLFNHWYHHRGQLLVYLRLLDVPMPSVYGPTADENPFGA